MQKPTRQFSKQFSYKSLIGSGTFGTVKKCIWNKSDILCAVKQIDNVNGMNIQKIQQEASIMQNAKSDFSLQLYDHFFDQENSQYILVMPYCKFGSLQKKINQEWELNNLLLFFYQITQAFVDFSQKQIMHLDLKPENILLKSPGEYLVCDFGCSRVIQDFAVSKNFLKLSISKGLGTPQYAAPQIQNDNKANKYSDVWSLGVILYKMIYHKSPFAKKMGMAFGAYRTTYQGHKPQFQPVVILLKRMLSLQKRPFWKQIRIQIFRILKLQNSINIVTSTSDYTEYIKNISVLGTCLLHHLDRIADDLQVQNIQYKPLLQVFMHYLKKLTQVSFNTDEYYMFDFTKNRMRLQQKLKIQQINKQIKQLIQKRGISQQFEKFNLKELKIMVQNQCRKFSDTIKKLPLQFRKQLQSTPQYQFFKVKKILDFINTQINDNLSYSRKKQLAEMIKYLIYS